MTMKYDKHIDVAFSYKWASSYSQTSLDDHLNKAICNDLHSAGIANKQTKLAERIEAVMRSCMIPVLK